MNPVIILSSVIPFTVCSYLPAQDLPAKEIKRVSISDVYIMGGGFSEKNNTTLADFYLLAPQSVILTRDLSDYSQENSFSFSPYSTLSMSVGIRFGNIKKQTYNSNPHLRMGISYFSGIGSAFIFSKSEQKPYDTLVSTQTGQQTYIDSVINESVYMNYQSEQIRFDASVIFRTNTKARWSLHCGLGTTLGSSINASSNIWYSKYSGTNSSNNPYGYSYNSVDEQETEKHSNQSAMGVSVYFPMGFDFRIGRKNEFWKKIHLFYELRPGINITSIPELRTLTNSCMQQGIGLRVSTN